MRPFDRYRQAALTIAMMLLIHAVAAGHAGEDHGDAAPAATQSAAAMQGDLLTTSGATDYFEIVAKYAATDAGRDTRVRLFVADFATNRPIRDAALTLAFKPAGAVVRTPPTAVAPGIYDVVVRFPRDTVYHLVATVSADRRTDFVEVRNLYAGDAAERFLEEHATTATAPAVVQKDGNDWLIALAIGLVVLAAVVSVVIVRRRKASKSIATIVAALLAATPLGRLGAHAGEDHGEAAPAATASSASGAGLTVLKEQQFALGMLTELVAPREIVSRVEVTGRVVPRTDAVAEVVPGVAGKVVGGRLPGRGEQVTRGQVLFHVAQVLSPAERGAIRAEQIRAKAELASAEREVSRLSRLEGVVAGKQITEARIRRDAARETVAALNAQLSGAGQSVAVTAPISGEITRAEIAAGEVIDGSEVVYEISDPSRIWIEADLFERDLPAIEGASSAEVTVPGAPGRIFRAKLHRLSGTVDPETRTVTALFTVDNPGRALRINMSARVSVASGRTTRGLTIPEAAIVRSGARQVVFVHTTPEGFEPRDVTLGAASFGGYVAITAGVRPGERLLVTATHQMRAIAGL